VSIKFKFENFAGIDTCEIELKPLTVLAGPNSVGKTYIVYAIYSALKTLATSLSVPIGIDSINQLLEAGSAEVQIASMKSFDYSAQATRNFMRNLPSYFSVDTDFFSDARVEISIPPPELDHGWSGRIQLRPSVFIEISKEAGSSVCLLSITNGASSSEGIDRALLPSPTGIRLRIARTLTELAFAGLLPRPFPITSERTGISLFWKELDISKNLIIDKLIAARGKKIDPWDFLEEETSRYAMPITDNIDVARDAEAVSKQRSFIAEDEALAKYVGSVFSQISGGRYRYGQDGISFEYGTGKKKRLIPIYVASSSSKSLFLLDLYINNIAEAGDVLVFDEPELNLHLANQRLMAQLLLRLVSVGVTVLVTTHSDFLIREFNDRIMLSKQFDGRRELMERAGIDERETLAPQDVAGYLLRPDRKLNPVTIDEFGLRMDSIDEAIAGSASLQGEIISLMSL
jgi:hypothetical protein